MKLKMKREKQRNPKKQEVNNIIVHASDMYVSCDVYTFDAFVYVVKGVV